MKVHFGRHSNQDIETKTNSIWLYGRADDLAGDAWDWLLIQGF